MSKPKVVRISEDEAHAMLADLSAPHPRPGGAGVWWVDSKEFAAWRNACLSADADQT